MLKEERRAMIVKIIDERDFVKNKTLSELTNSTIQTIISDINQLHDEGQIMKVYGGAKSIKSENTKSYERFDEEKENTNANAKDVIAQKAASLINDGDLIFLDTGTSTKKMAKYLENKNVSIVTNGYSIALELMKLNMEVCLVGGTLNPTTHATVGELSLKFLDNFNFDKVFIGMNNLYQDNFYTSNLQEATLKAKVINNSEEAFVLMDSSKFNTKNRIKVDTKKQITLISEQSPSEFNGNFISAK
ncbi:DeoR/GlpR family DNA-binding transcription regulator [[Acholeplasma] multilocale]|uniref:DeoR/GlpR family DNA-binding transcription regulator n=1 Tax=[Acholeplasma] multilocale TaxID=264638 RepID=UPI0003FDCA28|nr:DeoR/GlpR family DNA-binding transcription regulator [[Acholeplasma] multilocale]